MLFWLRQPNFFPNVLTSKWANGCAGQKSSGPSRKTFSGPKVVTFLGHFGGPKLVWAKSRSCRSGSPGDEPFGVSKAVHSVHRVATLAHIFTQSTIDLVFVEVLVCVQVVSGNRGDATRMAATRRTLGSFLEKDVDGSTPIINIVAVSQEKQWKRQRAECGCSSPSEPELCCAQSSLAWSHRGPRTRSRQRGSPREPQQCRGKLCRTNSEVGTSHRVFGQRQSTISKDFSLKRLQIGVLEIRGTSPQTTSVRGSSEEGLSRSVQVRVELQKGLDRLKRL